MTTLWFQSALLAGGWANDVRITLEAGRIAAIASGVPRGAEDVRGGAALPGLPNLHSHAFQRAMAGLTEARGAAASDSFWSWRELMYRFVGRLQPDDLEAIAALAFMEMLESGFTRVGEFHYLHHGPDGRAYENPAEMSERIAAAAAETGIGLTLLPVFYAQGGFGGAPPAEGQRRFLTTPDEYARLLDGCRRAVAPLTDAVVGVAPHSLRAVRPADLAAVSRHLGPVHIHIAEQVREVEDCVAWSGARPVEWLLDNAEVDARWCLVHATHMTAGETLRLAASGAVAGLCPVTEANLGDGLFPAAAFLEAGGAIGVGSDSNIRIEASEELRLLEYGQRLEARARNVLAGAGGASTGAGLYRRAVEGGGQALGRPGAVGLSVGAPADLVTLDGEHPDLAARSGDAILDSYVFSGGARVIRDVWRAGRLVVENGRHPARARIVARYRRTLGRLLSA